MDYKYQWGRVYCVCLRKVSPACALKQACCNISVIMYVITCVIRETNRFYIDIGCYLLIIWCIGFRTNLILSLVNALRVDKCADFELTQLNDGMTDVLCFPYGFCSVPLNCGTACWSKFSQSQTVPGPAKINLFNQTIWPSGYVKFSSMKDLWITLEPKTFRCSFQQGPWSHKRSH